VSPPASSSSEPAFSPAGHDTPGGTAAADIGVALAGLADHVIAILGRAPLALILGGSHATGEAVWLERDGRRVTLSDADFWAVLPDETTRRVTARRLAAGETALAREAQALGFLAPVEVTLVTPGTLASLDARPATLELAARGRVVAGDPSWLARLPRPTARDVSHEETLLLLENRAFELLGALPAPGATETGTRALRARHAVLKTALDLAAVLALRSGELPIGAVARVQWGRERLARDPALAPLVHTGLPELWDEALAWRAGQVATLAPAETAEEWHHAAVAWVAVWRHVTDAGAADPFVHAVRLAARASWPRRLRRSLFPAADPTSFARRWRAASRGTPQHRLNASAAILLIAAASAEGGPALEPKAMRALRTLDVTPEPRSWRECAATLLARWNEWVLGGRRAEGA
jgi:hypothetical protein